MALAAANQGCAALAAAAGPQQRLTYAEFLRRVGNPADAIRLSSGEASLPVRAGNAEANAVLADALWRARTVSGRPRAVSMRCLRSTLEMRPHFAVEPNSKSVLGMRRPPWWMHKSSLRCCPTSTDARLLLARCYSAAGDKAWVDRTLWTAFQEIPADEKIYAALGATRKGDLDATRDLQEEFDRQRNAKVNRGLL